MATPTGDDPKGDYGELMGRGHGLLPWIYLRDTAQQRLELKEQLT